MIKSLLKNISLLLATVIIMILFFELAVRLFYPVSCGTSQKGFYVSDSAACYKYAPNQDITIAQPEFFWQIKTNSNGLRDYELRPSSYRILALGDSIQLGAEVDLNRTYVKQLERMLSQNGSFEIVNAAFGGYGTYQELAFLEENYGKYKPDAVMLSFYLGNDFDNDISKGNCTNVVRDGLLVSSSAAESPSLLFRLKVFLNSDSRLYCFVKNKAVSLPLIGTQLHNDQSYLSVLDFCSSPLKENVQEAVSSAYDALGMMDDFAKSKGIPLILVALPSKVQVDPALWSKYGVGYNASIPSSMLAGFAANRSIYFVDLLPLMEREKARLYFSSDIHLTPEGHDAVAKYLYEALKGYSWAKIKNKS